MASRRSLSVAVMCFNEAATLERVVDRARSVLADLVDEYEIVIVDDGSRDGSGALADGLAASDPLVSVVHHPSNLGIGEVLRTAYRGARLRFISVIPADDEFDPEDWRAGVPLMDDRTVVNYTLTEFESPLREFISAAQRLQNRLLFSLHLTRLNWVKIVPTAHLSELPLISRSPAVEAELLVRLLRQGYRIVEIPSHNRTIVDRTGGLDARRLLRAIVAGERDTLRLWWRLRRSP